MTELNFETYKDKVMGCWTGKNIGGTLGASREGYRKTYNINFYTQDLTGDPPPNDDLDLQLVWLAAVERYGNMVNASILGDYWLSFVIPHWGEYGMAKNNMRAGLAPPFSGYVDNDYKNSNGCFIRSEIWACLAPGHPDIAVKYAYEDASVDHAEEGLYGELFCAALQSAAFVECDKDKLVDIGLSYIPNDCDVARCVNVARKCFKDGIPIFEARTLIHKEAPGSFGLHLYDKSPSGKRRSPKISEMDNEPDMEIGIAGYDAPENIGFFIAGWYYGDDFGDAICKTVNFGEDTDCTAATLGALMGIVMGESNLPRKWTEPLGGKITTMCIDNTSDGIWIPKTVVEFTDRVIRVTPSFLGVELCDLLAENGYTISVKSGTELYRSKADDYIPKMTGTWINKDSSHLYLFSPFIQHLDYPAFEVLVDYLGEPFFETNVPRGIRIMAVTNAHHMRHQNWVKIKLYVPEGIKVLGASEVELPLNYNIGSKSEILFEVVDETFIGSTLEMLVDVSLIGRHSYGIVKIVLKRQK